MKNCSTSSPPASHQATPTRNGYVPAPPQSPVVSVSRKSHCSGFATSAGASGTSNRNAAAFRSLPVAEHPSSSGNHRRKPRWSPKRLFLALPPRISANRSDPAGTSARKPRGSSPHVARFPAGFSAPILANLSCVVELIVFNLSASWPNRLKKKYCLRSCAKPFQNRERRFLRTLAFFTRWPNARRAALFARARHNQLARPPQQQIVHAIERLAESNPARIRVIQIKVRLEKFLHLRRIAHPRREFLPLRLDARAGRSFAHS